MGAIVLVALGADQYRAALQVGQLLRGHETQRPAPRSPQQRRLERAAAGQLPLARELGRLYAELDKLRAILRQHGIDPGDDPA